MLGHLLGQAGIDSVIIENRTREHVIDRVRAGVLEQGTVDLLCGSGVGDRLMREGMRHQGIYIAFRGNRHRIDMAALTGGRADHHLRSERSREGPARGAGRVWSPTPVRGYRRQHSRTPEPPAGKSGSLMAGKRNESSATSSPGAMGSTASAALPFLQTRSGASIEPTRSAGSASSPMLHHPPANWSTLCTTAASPSSACDRRTSPALPPVRRRRRCGIVV